MFKQLPDHQNKKRKQNHNLNQVGVRGLRNGMGSGWDGKFFRRRRRRHHPPGGGSTNIGKKHVLLKGNIRKVGITHVTQREITKSQTITFRFSTRMDQKSERANISFFKENLPAGISCANRSERYILKKGVGKWSKN